MLSKHPDKNCICRQVTIRIQNEPELRVNEASWTVLQAKKVFHVFLCYKSSQNLACWPPLLKIFKNLQGILCLNYKRYHVSWGTHCCNRQPEPRSQEISSRPAQSNQTGEAPPWASLWFSYHLKGVFFGEQVILIFFLIAACLNAWTGHLGMLETAGLTMLVEGFDINSIINHRTSRAGLLLPLSKATMPKLGNIIYSPDTKSSSFT